MISFPIIGRLLGEAEDILDQDDPDLIHPEPATAPPEPPARIDPAQRYYVLGDFHLNPGEAEREDLLGLLQRLLQEGGIAGVFLMGDLAARPDISFSALEGAHPRVFEALLRLSTTAPVTLLLGECDLQLELPDYLHGVERLEDEHWILLHGHQCDPSVDIERDSTGQVVGVQRGETDVRATVEGLRKLQEESGKKVVFGHVHRKKYFEKNLVGVGHWMEGGADYAILRGGEIFLASVPPRKPS